MFADVMCRFVIIPFLPLSRKAAERSETLPTAPSTAIEGVKLIVARKSDHHPPPAHPRGTLAFPFLSK
jgi:hypothetical protein